MNKFLFVIFLSGFLSGCSTLSGKYPTEEFKTIISGCDAIIASHKEDNVVDFTFIACGRGNSRLIGTISKCDVAYFTSGVIENTIEMYVHKCKI